MLPEKIFKTRIFNLADNEFQTTKFPDFLGKFPDFQRSLSNSLTFQVFQVLQVSGNPGICFVYSHTKTSYQVHVLLLIRML